MASFLPIESTCHCDCTEHIRHRSNRESHSTSCSCRGDTHTSYQHTHSLCEENRCSLMSQCLFYTKSPSLESSNCKCMERKTSKINSRILQCKLHPANDIVMNCKTCNLVICSRCKFEQHDTHASEDIQTAIMRIRPLLESHLIEINQTGLKSKEIISKLEQEVKSIKENQTVLNLKIENERERVLSEFLDRLEQDYGQLVTELTEKTESQLKKINMILFNIKNNVMLIDTLQTWANNIMTIKNDAAVLRDIQNSILPRIAKYKRAHNEVKTQIACQMTESVLYEFLPAPPQTLLGSIVIDNVPPNCTQDSEMERFTTPAKENFVLGSQMDNLRTADLDLSRFALKTSHAITNVKLSTDAYRFCIWQNKLWFPCCDDTLLKIYSLTGNLLKSIKLQGVQYPRSVYPIDSEHLALAASSGLFVLGHDGHVISCLHQGYFHDVSVREGKIAAIECKEDHVYIWDMNGNTYNLITAFPVLLTPLGYNTILLTAEHVFVGDGYGHSIHKYTVHGKHLLRYGNEQGTIPFPVGKTIKIEMERPKLCMVDKYNNVLVADWGKNHLKVISESQESEINRVAIARPCDAAILDGTLYALSGFKSMLIAKGRLS